MKVDFTSKAMHLTEEGVEVVFKLLLLKLGEPVVAAFVLNVAHGYLREVDLRRSKKKKKSQCCSKSSSARLCGVWSLM